MSRIPEFRLRALVALLLAVVVALPLFAEDDDKDRFELKYGRNFTFHGGRVSIDHGFGSLVVRTHAGSQVQVRATIRSSDENIGKQIQIIASEGPGGVTIRTEYPEIRNWRGHLSYSVDMNVTIPTNAPLTAKNRFGNIDARGLQTASVIENRQGSIKFQDAKGTQSLSNSFGSIEAIDVLGDLTVANNNGSVTVRKVEGALNVTNRFGSVDVADVKRAATITNSNGAISVVDVSGALKATNAFGSVKASTIGGAVDITNSNARVELSNVGGTATVRNSFGTVIANSIAGHLTVNGANAKVEADGIKGNAKIDTSFGAIELTNVAGMATVTSSNGSIKTSDIGGSLNAETRFGSIHAQRVRGAADAESSNGSITLDDIGTNVKARSSFGFVSVKGVGGAVDIVNSNGAISVAELRGGGCHPVSLRTNFSSIKVAIPDNAGYAVNARTTFGRIHSQIPITTTGMSEASLVGTIGKGGCKLDLVNSNGSITIERD